MLWYSNRVVRSWLRARSVCRQGLLDVPGGQTLDSFSKKNTVDSQRKLLRWAIGVPVDLAKENESKDPTVVGRLYTSTRSIPLTRPGREVQKNIPATRMGLSISIPPFVKVTIFPAISRTISFRHDNTFVLSVPVKGRLALVLFRNRGDWCW